MKKHLRLVASLLLAAAVIPAGGQDVVEEIVAIVNSDVITLSQYKEKYDLILQFLRSQFEGEEYQKQYQAAVPEILDKMISDVLLLQMAKERQLDVREQVKLTVENIKKQNNIESDEQLRAALAREGLDLESWMLQMEEDMLRQAVIFTEVDRIIALDDAEIVNYYKTHPAEFTEPAEFKLRVIYLSSEGKTGEELEARKKEVNDRLAAGEDFGELAGSFGEGPTREQSGDLGTFKEGELDPILETPLLNLAQGQTAPWVEFRGGWYLLKLEEKKESQLRAFEEIKGQVEEKLFVAKKSKRLQEFIKEMREQNYINILRPDPLNVLNF